MATFTAGSRGQAKEWSEIYEEIKTDYEQAFTCIDAGIKLDEDGKTREAIEKYEFGLNIIDKALSMPLECPENPDISWEKAYVMIQKMRKTRKEITMRISSAQSQPDPAAALPPPSYEEAMALPSSSDMPSASAPVLPPYLPPSAEYDPNLVTNAEASASKKENGAPTFADLSNQLNDLRVANNQVQKVLFSHDGVRIYFIAPDGRVSAPSDPSLLLIGKLQDDEEGLVYLQVGSWLYPLIPGISPCYRTDFGAYILPDVNSDEPGAAVGIILPQEADESVHQILSDILNSVLVSTEVDQEPKRPHRSRRSDRSSLPGQPTVRATPFSSNLVRGATMLANNLIRGADSTARFLDSATPKIIDKMQPRTETTTVNPTLQKTAEVAKTVTGKAADATDYLATKLGLATSALGRYLAPHIQKQGTRLLTSTTNMSEGEASQKIDSALDVTSDAVQSVAMVYGGLQSAAGLLGRSLSNNTVQIIKYKYGDPMAHVAGDTFSTAGNIYTIRGNYKVFKPMGIAKSAAKGAGNALIEEHKASKKDKPPHDEFKGPGPGDGSGFKKEPL